MKDLSLSVSVLFFQAEEKQRLIKEVRLLNPCIDTTTLLQNESLFIDTASKNAQKHHSSPHKNGHKKQIFYDAEKKKSVHI